MNEDFRTDALLEVTNIGAGQAATALSMMLLRKVLITVPNLKLMPIEDISQTMGGSESPVVGVYFTMTGDLSGRILLVFDHESGHHLVSLITGNPEHKQHQLDEMDKSAMMETCNIIANSYLNGIAGLLDIKLFPSVPFFAEDTFGAVVDSLLIEIAMVADKALLIDTEMSIENENLKSVFFVFPDEEFINIIYKKLGLANS
jgi:chemotaxis protein CheC